MNFSIPSPLWSLHQRIIDEHGRLNEIPAGKYGDFWITVACTHTRHGRPYGIPVHQYGPDGNHDKGIPVVALYERPVDNSWAITKLPPIGAAVWQLKGRYLEVVRTAKIAAYRPGFVGAVLLPEGPYAGIPIGGDSGSVCYVEQDGEWKVMGIVNFAGSCETGFWTEPISFFVGITIPARISHNFPTTKVEEQDFYRNQPTCIPFPMKPLFLTTSPTNRRVVGALTEGDDGTDNVVLDVPCSKEPKSIIINGTYTDCWAWPDNNSNWIIRAIRLDEARIRLFFKQAREAQSYFVIIDGMPTINASPVNEEGDTEIVQKPTINQSELDDLRLTNAKLAMDNADLRADIANEQSKSAELQAKINAFRAAINNIIK